MVLAVTGLGDASPDVPQPPPEESRARPGPPGLPPGSVWVDAEDEWQHVARDVNGLPHGRFRSWRADGTLRSIAGYDHGKQVGTSWRFHPDGSLFSLGLFSDGQPRGVHRRYASERPGGERLQSCCVPAGAWQLRQDYSSPQVIDRCWFNRAGTPLLESGEPHPDRPALVPAGARFNEDQDCWEMGAVLAHDGYRGTRTRWSRDGVLRLIEELVAGQRHGLVRAFDGGGSLAWEGRYRRGRLCGPFRALNFPAGFFADPAVRHQQGFFEDDQAEGRWLFLDDGGTVLHERDLGRALDEQALASSSVLTNESRTPDAWRSLARECANEGRIGESLLAWARAAATSGDGAALAHALRETTLPVGPEAARVQTQAILDAAEVRMLSLVDDLKRGGDAPALFWGVAKALKEADRAALDFVTAAILLAPDRPEPLATRALLLGSLGKPDAARADISRLASASTEQAEMLELVMRAYFPRFDFWPAKERLPERPELGPEQARGEESLRPDRTLADVRQVVMRYASRLQLLRAALRERVGDAVSFMIPDLSALLPEGPVALRRWTFTMSPEEFAGDESPEDGSIADGSPGDGSIADAPVQPVVEGEHDPGPSGAEHATRSAVVDPAGPGTITIVVDETFGLTADADTTLFSLLRRARADWSGLTWLCWAVGLNATALPEAIRPPAAFGRAAVMTMERTWRCRDKLNTSGLLALTKGIPGFDWEGTPIDLVPMALAEVALDEYLEARTVFSWLCDPANQSPWQDDLRVVD